MTERTIRKHHLMIDRRWIDWTHGSGAPEGAFRFRVCPPTKRSEPLMVADKPWESMSTGWHTILRDQGMVRCWYEAWDKTYQSDFDGRLCYAESDDGIVWRKPELGLVAYQGSKRNNILIDKTTEGYGYGLHGSSVFVDPTAEPKERYKIIYLGATRAAFSETRTYVLVMASSGDGLHWNWRHHFIWGCPQSLLGHGSDTQTVVYWNPDRRAYVGYFRTWELGYGRCIGYAETNDFYNWPLPQTIMRCDHLDGYGTDLYTNAASRYVSGDETATFLFPSMFDHETDDLAAQLAISRDGRAFTRPDRTPFIANGPEPFDRGGVYVVPGILPFQDGLAIYYHGVSFKHGEVGPTKVSHQGMLGMAACPRDRLLGICSDEAFAFCLAGFGLDHPHLQINANVVVEPGGELRAALFADNKPLPGYGFDDAVPIVGDQPAARVTWKQPPPLGPWVGKPVRLRFRLSHATLFSVTC